MKVKLLGPVMGLVVGLGIAIGCGGSSGSDVTADNTTDSGATTTPPGTPPGTPPPGSPDGSPPDGSPSDASTKDVFVPGTAVAVQYGNCSNFSPCGGNPVGTWTYAAGGCLDAIDLSKCQNATITNPDIKVKGQVTFTGSATAGTVSRLAEVSLSATVFLPNSCANVGCAAMEFYLKSSPPLGAGMDSASCAAMNNGCQCAIAKTTVDNGSEAYTVAGNVITTGTGQSARTYDFCINPANTFTYQETTQGAQQKATLVMTK